MIALLVNFEDISNTRPAFTFLELYGGAFDEVFEYANSYLWCVISLRFLLWGQHVRLKLVFELDDVDTVLTFPINLSTVAKLEKVTLRSHSLFVGWVPWSLTTIGIPLGGERQRGARTREGLVAEGDKESIKPTGL